MAVEKVGGKFRFSTNLQVEIRSAEDGFHGGSWRKGRVVNFVDQCYHVIYDEEYLFDDCSERLLEVVPATSSRLRPSPPLVHSRICGLRYGMCVDVYHRRAWWEGVIFDRGVGSDKRVVFVLDSCTEEITEIQNLRATVEWNEFTEVWNRRGMWPLFELIGDCAQDWAPELLVKIWRVVKGNFRNWDCGKKSLTKEFVSQLIKDLDKPILDGCIMNSDQALRESRVLLSCENPSIDHVNNEIVNAVDSAAVPTDCEAVLPSENPFHCCDVVADIEMMNQEVTNANSDGSEVILPGEMSVNGYDSSTGSVAEGEGILTSAHANNLKRNRKRKRKSTKLTGDWLPLGPDMLGGAEFRPGVISKYASFGTKRPPESLTLDVRKHLTDLGWKIECSYYNGSYRYRYTSPDNSKAYLSLRQLCHDLKDDHLANDKESPDAASQSHSRRQYDLCPSEVDPRSGEVAVGSGGYTNQRHQKNQNSSIPKKKRGKIIATLKKVRDNKIRQKAMPISSNRSACSVFLSSLIDNNIVLPGANVHYRTNKARSQLTTGRIIRDGIECDCCQNIFSLTGFEAHAGSTNHRPAAHIILEDGRSLFDCKKQLAAGNKKESVARKCIKKAKQSKQQGKSDYICSICHDVGDLILCDGCPSAFHARCLDLENVPEGDWFCPCCCCNICHERNFQENIQQPVNHFILSCIQCEHNYHAGCLRNRGLDMLEREDSKDKWFCSNRCRNIFFGLQKLLGKPIVVGPDNLTWTLLKSNCDLDISTEYRRKRSLALKVMHECFEPVTESYTGRDLLEDLFFNRASELTRLNFEGFYSVLLERNDEVISVANVRIFGEKVAEVPLVATRFQDRRHGMCRILMNELEKQLASLEVERLMLPAVASVLDTWINGFGFSKLTDSERRQYLDHIFLDFPGTVMCQKILKKF